MAKTLNVRPHPKFEVRSPDTGELLPAEGGQVPDNAYWRDRIREGMVVDLDGSTPDQYDDDVLAAEYAELREAVQDLRMELLSATAELDESNQRVAALEAEVEELLLQPASPSADTNGSDAPPLDEETNASKGESSKGKGKKGKGGK